MNKAIEKLKKFKKKSSEISLSFLAKFLEVDSGTVYRWLSEISEPSEKHQAKIISVIDKIESIIKEEARKELIQEGFLSPEGKITEKGKQHKSSLEIRNSIKIKAGL